MDNEEQVFDFMAAAEDTGRRLDDLVKAIPGEIRQTLANEYRKSPWVSALLGVAGDMAATVKHVESAADKTDAAAENVTSAAYVLLKKARFAGALACVGAVALPLATWGVAYWQVRELRAEREILNVECELYKELAAALKDETGGGVSVAKDGNQKWFVASPFGVEVDTQGYYKDGRFGFSYTWPSAVK